MDIYFRAFHGPSDWGWVQQHLPLKRIEDTGGIVAIDREKNETVAACVLDTWTENSVQAHLIMTTPMVVRHGFFEEVTDYVFNVAGRGLMIGLVPENNEAALSVDAKIGFRECARVPDAVSEGVGIVILTMTPDDCRYYTPRAAVPLEVPDGQGLESAATA